MAAEKKKIAYIPNDEFFTAVRQMLDSGKEVDFTVTGNSMWPLLKHGRDRVVLTSCKAQDIRKGDVILFEALPSKYLLHRVTKLNANTFETTGDFNTFRDGSFSRECVIGKAVKTVRNGKSYSTKSFFMRFYSAFWRSFYFARKPLIKLLFRFQSLKQKRIDLFVKTEEISI